MILCFDQQISLNSPENQINKSNETHSIFSSELLPPTKKTRQSPFKTNSLTFINNDQKTNNIPYLIGLP